MILWMAVKNKGFLLKSKDFLQATNRGDDPNLHPAQPQKPIDSELRLTIFPICV